MELIHWEGYEETESTWESVKNIPISFIMQYFIQKIVELKEKIR
jgi:hypothetical protein